MSAPTTLNEATGPFLSDFRVWEEAEGTEVHAYELAEPFMVRSEVLGAVVTVPKGFKFDGESIPAALAWLVKPMGESRRGACVHDYLYRFAGYKAADGKFVMVNRATADAVYKELVIAKGLPAWRATVRWAVLRLVGGAAWRGNNATHYTLSALITFACLLLTSSCSASSTGAKMITILQLAVLGLMLWIGWTLITNPKRPKP